MSPWRENKQSSDGPDDRRDAVEVVQDDEDVWVRDPKDPDGPKLHFTLQPWQRFLDWVAAEPDPAA
ncbi:DUF397 domain-containing protein [Lentzea sp. NEAU-D13]|uniref:DUF397 domain-containing protein n=1 Tax=Lentzea alba TaxID=2714351 RepID=A0A7C9W1W9_9PSEU|nr:DUF397 domain-containing protein [Lentzea alba]NGY61939.1 DUF397 domain-containing protein [Lentzea alba]